MRCIARAVSTALCLAHALVKPHGKLCSFCRDIDFKRLFFYDLPNRTFIHSYPNDYCRSAPRYSEDAYLLGTLVEVRQRAQEGYEFCDLVLRERSFYALRSHDIDRLFQI